MQSLSREREQAILLRKQGFSYTEIMKTVPVSKASLSLWLSKIPLTKMQSKRLAAKSSVGQKAAAKARHQQRLDKHEKLKLEVGNEFQALVNDPFFTMGLALYWAEGNKQYPWNLSARAIFNNSDPLLILLMRDWFRKFFNVTYKDFFYSLSIHESADKKAAINEWAKILSIPAECFQCVIKRNVVVGRHKRDNYKGLIRLGVRKSIWLNRRITLYQEALVKSMLASY
jgi:hypothetical protein